MEHQPNNKQVRQACPKGMKLHRSVKAWAALIPSASKADRKYFMRILGTANHDAAIKAKASKRDVKLASAGE